MAVEAEDLAARLKAEFPHALRSGQLVAYYQPEVELSSGRVVAAESVAAPGHRSGGRMDAGRRRGHHGCLRAVAGLPLGGHQHQALIGDLAFFLPNAAGGYCAWRVSRRTDLGRATVRAWRLLSVAIWLYLLGDAIQLVYEVVLA